MKRQTLLLVPLLAAFSLAGCAVRAAYVAVPPPAARYEVIGVAPGPGFVWCDGYWNWAGSRYVWVQGYWARPARAGARWEPGHWEHRHGRYEFERGHWR
jgi:YXWGXW repeat-containing protein